MKLNNKFNVGDKVVITLTGEQATISNYSYIQHMKKFSYTTKENPKTFYFEEEIVKM